MRLEVSMVDEDSTLNDIKFINQVEITPGETRDICFMLVRSGTKTTDNKFGQRYIPSDDADVEVTLTSLNDTKTVTRTANQKFSGDKSIWNFSVNAEQTKDLPGVNMEVKVTENDKISIIRADSVIVVSPQSPFMSNVIRRAD